MSRKYERRLQQSRQDVINWIGKDQLSSENVFRLTRHGSVRKLIKKSAVPFPFNMR